MSDYLDLWKHQADINEANEMRFKNIINALETTAECLAYHAKRMKEMENEIDELKRKLKKYEEG